MLRKTRFVIAACTALAFSTACAPTMILDAGGTVVEDRSIEEISTDTGIKAKIIQKLAGTDGAPFISVSTDVFRREVMITGAVDTTEARSVAERIARSAKGVKRVYNDIQVTNEGGLKATAKDIMIETKLKAQLLGAKGIKSVNYRFRSVNRTIYFIGVAQSQSELNQVRAIARKIEDVKGTVSHVRVR